MGDYMGIRYGRVPDGTGEVEWHFVSHAECDGIGGFARMLREHGVEPGKLPETRHPGRGVIVPLWNLWRDRRKFEECAERTDWPVPAGERGVSEAVAWHLFTAGETQEIVARCRESGITMNSFLLKHLDQAVRPDTRRTDAKIRWVIPVNLRSEIRDADDTANQVSCIEVSIAPDDTPESIHRQTLHNLNRGEHRANHLLLVAGGILSHACKVSFLVKDRAKPAGNIGAFSNLGVWSVPESPASRDGWLFCPPVVTGQLLGAGCVTFQGRLGLALQGHPTLSATPEIAHRWMSRWLDLIQER